MPRERSAAYSLARPLSKVCCSIIVGTFFLPNFSVFKLVLASLCFPSALVGVDTLAYIPWHQRCLLCIFMVHCGARGEFCIYSIPNRFTIRYETRSLPLKAAAASLQYHEILGPYVRRNLERNPSAADEGFGRYISDADFHFFTTHSLCVQHETLSWQLEGSEDWRQARKGEVTQRRSWVF